jgi:hypothetical protein
VTIAYVAKAEPITPDYVKENFPLVYAAPCTDQHTDELGSCFFFERPDGFYYLVFVQENEAMEMRETAADGYRIIWQNPAYTGSPT